MTHNRLNHVVRYRLRHKAGGLLVAPTLIGLAVALFPVMVDVAKASECNGKNVPNAYEDTDGPDIITGNSDANAMNAHAGSDKTDGRADWDDLCNGDGDDRSFGGIGEDEIFGGEGCDGISGEDNSDRIHGNEGHDTGFSGYGGCGTQYWLGPGLYGNGGQDDRILGGLGNDYISGGDGSSDYADAGDGDNDVCDVDSTETVIACEHFI